MDEFILQLFHPVAIKPQGNSWGRPSQWSLLHSGASRRGNEQATMELNQWMRHRGRAV